MKDLECRVSCSSIVLRLKLHTRSQGVWARNAMLRHSIALR